MKSRIRLFRKWKWVKLREVSLPWGSWLCRYRWRWEACRWGGRRRCGRGCWLWPPGPPPRPSDGGNRLPGCWIARRLFGIGKESEKFKSSYKRNQGKTRRGGSQPRRKEAQRANTSRSGFLRRQWLVAEGNGDFEVVGEGQRLDRSASDGRAGEQRHIGYDVSVNHFGVDLVTWHGLQLHGHKKSRWKWIPFSLLIFSSPHHHTPRCLAGCLVTTRRVVIKFLGPASQNVWTQHSIYSGCGAPEEKNWSKDGRPANCSRTVSCNNDPAACERLIDGRSAGPDSLCYFLFLDFYCSDEHQTRPHPPTSVVQQK